MIQDLGQIEYRRCMLEKGMKPKIVPIKIWREAEISENVHAAIHAENLLALGGVYGDRSVGDSVEYDNL